MDISNKIKALRNKSSNNQKAKTLLMATILGTSPVLSQATPEAERDTTSTTITQNINSQAKQYHKIVEVSSLTAMRMQNYAEYHPDIDAIVYNQFKVTNADKYQQRQIDNHNVMCYSPEIENHELQHRAFHLAGISTKVEDGSCILSSSDVIRAKILEELLCKKAENKNRPMSEVIADFKQDGHEEYYVGHYLSETKNTSILSALIAEEKCPETIKKAFEQATDYKTIDENHFAGLHISADGKYQVWEILTNRSEFARDSSLVDKSPVKIGVLLDKDGNEVKTPDGNNIKAEPILTRNGQYVQGYSFPNIDKETQGYEFTKAQNNFNNLCQEYMTCAELSSEDRTALMNYINTDLAYLSQYNQSDFEIAEIKEM